MLISHIFQAKKVKITTPQSPQTFGFFLTEGFSLPAYTSLSETFRIANDIVGNQLFQWYTVGKEVNLVTSATGLQVKVDFDIESAPNFHQLAVISSLNSHAYNDKKVLRWLRLLNQRGCFLGGITSGSWILAKANLLSGYRFTIHWQDLQAFQETYPDLHVTHSLYEIDRNRFSCASGLAALDMILDMIANNYGYDFALHINDRLIHEKIRSGEELQMLHTYIKNSSVRRAVLLMEKNIETPLPLSTIAKESLISLRQMTRLFQSHLGLPPQQHYISMRLDRAASLLRQTDLTITKIAIATGFEYLGHFSTAFKKRYQQSPSQYRKG